MHSLVAALLSMLPAAALKIAAKVLGEEALQRYIERVIIYALEKLTPLSTNTLDDEIAREIIERLRR